MTNVVKALESDVNTAFNISIVSDVLSTPTTASDLPITGSTQAPQSVTHSSSSSIPTSDVEPSSSQTSSELAKTSKTKNIASLVSTSSLAASISASAHSITTTSSSSTITAAATVSSITESSPTLTTDVTSTADTRATQGTSSASSISSSSAISTTSTTLSTSVTMAPIPQSSIASASTTVNPQSEARAGNGPQSHVAAIVVASVMGACILATILYLIFRYCPPVRDRWEAHKEKNRTGAYRDTMGTRNSPSLEKGTDKNRRSFQARNWYWNGTQGSVEGEGPGTGLGLGPVASLRQQALAETSDRPPPRVYAMRQSQIGRAVE